PEACRRAGTVHCGGALPEISAAERTVGNGRVPPWPFVLVTQPSLFDPTRVPGDGRHLAWAYCHVPLGSTKDMTAAIEAQVERFAPGFRDRILARHVLPPAALEQYNANYIGGAIAGGSHEALQLFMRPTIAADPYRTAMRGVYICSSSTPPGAGVHGMCGYWAARSALRHELRA
ncbi:MAG: phytoene desaturase family protein, partial [Hyphomicrobiales bacterium]